jgi:hypothetical protein
LWLENLKGKYNFEELGIDGKDNIQTDFRQRRCENAG